MAENRTTKNASASVFAGEEASQERIANDYNQSQKHPATDELMLKVNTKALQNGAAVHKSTDVAPPPNVKVSNIIGEFN